MAQIIGRKEEQKSLNEYFESKKSEFIAVYGRRRIGKTFLIRECFGNKFDFYFSGSENIGRKQQLANFNIALQKYGKSYYPQSNLWFDAFKQLIEMLEKNRKKGRKLIFLDELPWIDTPRSNFIQALEYFWNTWASARSDILLIVCGSATSWIINKIIKNRGGLHNRITGQIVLEPFTLTECEKFAQNRKLAMTKQQIVDCYMIIGGVPYYWDLLEKSLSLSQNIDNLFFRKKGMLREEFLKIYNSLFKNSENYVKIIVALSKKRIGLTRDEIISVSGLSDGGTFSRMLEELEQCGFIRTYHGFAKKTKNTLYQLIDLYSFFYLTFIKDRKNTDENFWSNQIGSSKQKSWCGYAFEQVCLLHIAEIRKKLGISGVLVSVSSWKSKTSEPGAQIDLLIDRNDKIINLCEIKYSDNQFIIDKKTDENLRNKRAAFIAETQTNKAIHITMITTYGVKKNAYLSNIQSEITMNNLFE